MTYYTSLAYTNYTLVTDWYVAGNEIADHTYVLLRSFSLWVLETSGQTDGKPQSRCGAVAATPIMCPFGSPDSWLSDVLE